ncbi:MAG: hypothetical protein AAF086_05680 [Planctomycetota bacterium]
MATDNALFYKHSGKFSPTAPVAMVVAGGGLGLLTGALYGVMVAYSPIIYLNLVATVGTGFAVGWGVLKMARAQRVRNPALVAGCGVLAGLVAWYGSWVTWLWAMGGWSMDWLVLRPDYLYYISQELAIDGVWSIGSSGTAVSGLALKGVWVVEALIMLVIGGGYPAREIARTPYSETERAWADYHEVLPPLALIPKTERKGFKQRLKNGDFTVLAELGPVAEDELSWTQYQLISTQPEGGGESHFLTIRTVENAVNKKGEVTTTNQVVARNVIIDAESRDLIKQIVEADRPAPDTASALVETADTTDAADPVEPN